MPPGHRSAPDPLRRLAAALAVLVLVVASCGIGDDGAEGHESAGTSPAGTDGPASSDDDDEDEDDDESAGVGQPFERVDGATTTARYEATEGAALWGQLVPEIEEVRIPSSVDDRKQPAMWLPPEDDDGDVPLLVVLHSFSYGYAQHAGIPFAQWAEAHGWAMIHPHFGGPFGSPESSGSDESVADVLDAIEFALEQGDVDGDRVYLLGFSGGGQMGLVMGGRHPDRFAGIVAWVPVLDLVEWHAYNLDDGGTVAYAWDIESACGGDPQQDAAAEQDCLDRSPVSHLDDLASAEIPVYLGHGADDEVVPPSDAIRAYEELTGEDVSDDLADLLDDVAGADALGEDDRDAAYFDDLDPDLLHVERSDETTLALFRGGHDMVFHPGLRWLYELAGGDPGL